MFQSASRCISLLLISWLVLGCNFVDRFVVPPTATPSPTLTPTPVPTLAPATEIPDTGWQVIRPGLERRMIRFHNDQAQQIEVLSIFRLDQNHFRLDVAYHETPQSLEDWQRETGALLVVNGGFFRVENERYIPNGLTIINGQASGSSYDSFAGMLAISALGAEVRWLAQRPYDRGEALQAALQSFPLLVKPGGELGFPEAFEDHIQARRTVIAQDRQGRILFLVTPRGYFTLHKLSKFLTGSDLDLDVALNLDGGPSTGILVAEPPEIIPSLSLLPVVILAHPR